VTRKTDSHLTEFLRAWRQNPTLPLEVTRARYDVPFPHSWEVMHYETPTCSVPIAEFTEWAEAQAWADTNARWAAGHGAEVRRFRYGFWPSGNWGGIGYFDHSGGYHELPDPHPIERESEFCSECAGPYEGWLEGQYGGHWDTCPNRIAAGEIQIGN
jgi:hypothetical protein